ncbi:SDA1-like protein [Cryptotermes secundus]|uniref:Protein SDA1 n=1 Tax=Cryptotermes secundus TaxID=105785 RepID=A0A2J7REK4_9NEOP|nr:protein SDA1 homolog [Cryptotermes secundus]PNF39265.1 SDA1-like protein [Cryptotermes secundus]
MARHNNQLPDNLPQLQNLIKRDPASYKDEFLLQYRHYQCMLDVFRLHPSEFNKSLDDLVMFIAQVSHCYPDVLSNYPQELVDILQTHFSILDSAMRMTLCRALILLRNKNLLTPTDLLSLFFHLLRCQDKALRKFLETHIITDIKNMNAKHKNARLNMTLQNFMFSMLKDSNSKAAKMSLAIMIELYKKNVWNDAKTVNVIATACFSKFTKVMVAALKFFLGSDPEDEKKSDDSDSDNEVSTKEVLMANRVNKKTRKREKQLKKVKQLVKKSQKKKGAPSPFNFSALHLVHDPQGLAEKLFQQLEKTNERFEVKIMTLDVVSRLIGLHQLFLLNYYPYIQRFMQPHQREVTKILQFAAQASHELVPPDVLEPVLKTLVNNFVTERNSADVIAIGLNAVREICNRCPLVMSEDLLRDLAQYKNYKERSVMMAARSLIHLYRTSMPELLHKKDRGRPTEASIELKSKKYGEVDAKDYIPGAEVLLQNGTEGTSGCGQDDDGSSDDEWIDISHSSEGDAEENISTQEEVFDRLEDDQKCDHGADDENEEEDGDKDMVEGTNSAREGARGPMNKIQQAVQASQMRLLTDEDFRKIDAARLSKEVTALKRGKKRPAEEEASSKRELVSLADIENIYKKRRHDKEARQESVKRGQVGREKFGFQDRRLNAHSSKTNREKRKTKNYMMLKHKARGKLKRSFKEKQIALRNHLLRLKKMK